MSQGPQFREDFIEGISRYKKSGQVPIVGKTVGLTAMKKDGTEIPVGVPLSVGKIKGEWNAVGIVREITEHKRAENM